MFKKLVVAGVLMSMFGFAQASDHGCQVLLCLANPAGPMKLGECVPPIKKLFKDLAKGKVFPSCNFSSGAGQDIGASKQHFASNKAAHAGFCHPDYLAKVGKKKVCLMKGAVTTTVDGVQTSRIWWDAKGNSVTEDAL